MSLPALSRTSLESKSVQLIKSLYSNVSSTSYLINKLKETYKHLLEHPEASGYCMREGALPIILKLREYSKDPLVKSYSRRILALMGYSDPPKGYGIRILSIDGGGTKGIMVLEVLKQIEKCTGQQIYQLFDLICGVSTGAILCLLLGALRIKIEDCDTLYRKSSSQMFNQDVFRGASRLLWTHAYYDTSAWENILRDVYGDRTLIETASCEDTPKIMAASSIINTPTIQPFVFRNYNIPDGSFCYYEGSCKYKLWQAIRASAAAPGYFEEFLLDQYVHQDGGVLMNNPAAIAIHEAKLIWPNEYIQSCISIGTGKYSPMNLAKEEKASLTSLRTKIARFIDSATDTETVHRVLQDLLKSRTYYRFNPPLSEYVALDEARPEKLSQMRTDALMYLRRNDYKLNESIVSLIRPRTHVQKIQDWLKLKYIIHSF